MAMNLQDKNVMLVQLTDAMSEFQRKYDSQSLEHPLWDDDIAALMAQAALAVVLATEAASRIIHIG